MTKASEAFGLPRPARTQWLAEFCTERLPTPSRGPRFPALTGGQFPSDWIIHQYRVLDDSVLQANLRESVTDLIYAQGGHSNQHRDQVLGAALYVAGVLQFHDIKSVLARWVRTGWINKTHSYRLGNLDVPIRRTVWSLLIGWSYLDHLVPQLARDLTALVRGGETGTAQLCYVELGHREPAMALELIPEITVTWHRSYWTEAVERFLIDTGPNTLLTTKFSEAWSRCLGPCLFNINIYPHLRDAPPLDAADVSRPIWLKEVLKNTGIIAETNKSTRVVLRTANGARLDVDVRRYTNIADYGGSPTRAMSLSEWSKETSREW
jgi:hypothetical protein